MTKWLITRTETITVEAQTEDHALFLGEQLLDFYDAETTDVQAEELSSDEETNDAAGNHD